MQKVHLIGIEGIGMSGLAELLLAAGYEVSGCDLRPGAYAQRLASKGATIMSGHCISHIHAKLDIVVASPAVDQNHPELAAAARQNIPVLRYTEMLSQLMHDRRQIAVAGTHGKSTTTGMLTWLMHSAGLAPSFVVGANVPQLESNAGLGQSDFFVVEACEYRRSFLKFTPESAIVTNIEADHLDYYRDLDDIVMAFEEFAAKLAPQGILVIDSEAFARFHSKPACQVATYRMDDPAADWRVANIAKLPCGHTFDVLHQGQLFGNFTSRLPGMHNVGNSLAVIAMGHFLGIALADIQTAIASYEGVGRRFEILAKSPVTIISDYAHHPTKVKALLQATREVFDKAKLWMVYQPHQANRTYKLFAEFTRAFELADEIIITDIFYARDSQADRDRVSGRQLADAIAAQGKECRHLSQFAEIAAWLRSRWQPGDVVLVAGAGTIVELAEMLAGDGANPRESVVVTM